MRNLVSHGTNTAGQNECYGEYDDTNKIAWGPSYQHSCIHSGSNEYSGGDTVWYGYVLASAGTIVSENTTQENPANNSTPATESICPKGWTLPSSTQIRTIANNTSTYVSSFDPVYGGRYYNNELTNMTNSGRWWSSEAANGSARYRFDYQSNGTLQINSSYLMNNYYVRCVVKKNTKTLSNLTYMQDMTPQTSFWTLVNGRSYDEV